MSNLVHNERLKLRATFLSNLGIAAFIACFVTPGFFEFAETRIERLVMALIGLDFLRRPPCSRHQQAQRTERRKRVNRRRIAVPGDDAACAWADLSNALCASFMTLSPPRPSKLRG